MNSDSQKHPSALLPRGGRPVGAVDDGPEVLPSQAIAGFQNHNDKFSVLPEQSQYPVKQEAYYSSSSSPYPAASEAFSPYASSSTAHFAGTPGSHTYFHPGGDAVYAAPSSPYPDGQGYGNTTTANKERRICGLRRMTFVLAAIIVILILGGVAGGVAGGLLSKKGNTSSS